MDDVGYFTVKTLPQLKVLFVAENPSVAFYWQSVSGHVAILRAARPIDDWLNDATTSAPD